MDEPHIRIEVLNSEGDVAPVERGIGGCRGRVRIPLGLIGNGVEVVDAAEKRFELVAQLIGGSEVRQRGLAVGIKVLYEGPVLPPMMYVSSNADRLANFLGSFRRLKVCITS